MSGSENPVIRGPWAGRAAAGILLFVLLTAGGYAAVRLTAGPQSESLLASLSRVRRGPLVLAGLLLAAEFTVWTFRFWILAREVKPSFGWWDGFQVNMYLITAAGITPMSLGAGPAQYYAMRRKGLTGHDALAVMSVNWVGGLVGLLVVGGASMWYVMLSGDLALPGIVRNLVWVLGGVIVAALAVTFFPRYLTRILIGIRPLRRTRRGRRALLAISRYRGTVEEFRESGRRRRAWVANFLANIVALVLRCLIGVAILAALGVRVDTLSAVARQALQFSVMYVAPTPGGSGVAELTTIGLMAGLVPAALMVPYTVMWRVFTSYLGIVIGGLVVAVDLFGSNAANRINRAFSQ